MGTARFWLVFFWYALPFLYVSFVEGVVLYNTAPVLVVFLLGLTFGFFLFNRVCLEPNIPIGSILDKFFKSVFFTTLLVQLYGFYRALSDGFDLARYRMDFFEAAGGVFKSTYLFTLYSVFLVPLLLLGTMYWVSKDLYNKKNKRFVLFLFLLIVLDAILSLGRFQYLFVLFFFYLSYKAFGFKKVALFFGFTAILALSFITIYFRQFFVDSAVDSAVEIVNADVARNSIISYQYNGYAFMDKLLAEKPPLGQPWQLNTPSFGFLFAKIISTKVGVDFNYPWESYNLMLTEGAYDQRLDLLFNAFTTNLFPVFLDLGYPGVLIYGIFSGVLLGFRTKNQILKAVQYLNLFMLIFGLYQPIITMLNGFILQVCMFFLVMYALREYLNSQKHRVLDIG